MGRTSSGGLPYPEPTDPVANGANDIKALANEITSQWIRSGSFDGYSDANGLAKVTIANTTRTVRAAMAIVRYEPSVVPWGLTLSLRKYHGTMPAGEVWFYTISEATNTVGKSTRVIFDWFVIMNPPP